MNKYQQAQKQNLKVWARRLNVPIIDEHYLSLARLMPGSVLVGPLAMVISNRLRETISEPSKRFKTAQLLARALASHIRGETKLVNILAMLAFAANDSEDKVLLSMHSPVLVKLFSEAINARTSEKSRPSVGNVIAKKIAQR